MSRPLAILKFVSAATICIAGAAFGWTWLGPVVVAGWLLAQSFYSPAPIRQIGLVAIVGLLGTTIESGLIQASFYMPQGMLEGIPLCPQWIIAIWIALGLIAPVFAPSDRLGYIRLAVCGALLAPLVYLAADAVPGGALHLKRPVWPTLVLLALLWQGLWPGICWLANSRWYRTRNASD